MPILTNAHTHLELGWSADHCPSVAGEPFAPWLSRLVESRWGLGERKDALYAAAIEEGILDLLSAGTTHVGDVTATGKSIGPLLASGLSGIVYVEVVGLDPSKADDYLRRAQAIIEQWRAKEHSTFRLGLAIHAPYSTSVRLWQKALAYAEREALPLCIHVAESPAEYDYLALDTGPLVDTYYFDLHLPPLPSPMRTPVQYLEDLGALALKPLLVHGVHVTQEDIMRIAEAECAVVHCPRSNLRLECGRMPLEAYLAAGVTVYLGTECRASTPTLDVRDDLEVAVALHHGRVPPEQSAALAHQPLGDGASEG